MNLARLTPSLLLLAASVLAGCGKSPEPASPPVPATAAAPVDAADTIYTGGDIVTVNDKLPAAEALAVKGGKIGAVGARADVEKAHKGGSTLVVDGGVTHARS